MQCTPPIQASSYSDDIYYCNRIFISTVRVVPFVAVLVVFVGIIVPAACGQDMSFLVRDTLRVSTDSLQLKPFVIKNSVRVWQDGAEVRSSEYSLDPRVGTLVLETPADSLVVVAYRYLPLRFSSATRSHLLRTERQPDSTGFANPVLAPRSRESGTPPQRSRLTRSGSITRGVIAGNNQDVAIESGLRLSLAGEITDGVQLKAVLTDQNTPILPEGTTQRLDEFDKVAIEVSSDRGVARLGDFDAAYTRSRYARLNRKLQGASVDVKLSPSGPLAGGSFNLSGATSRGTYRTQTFTPIDGSQGPYRMEGNSGERFILVVPGSEVVYLDGIRLTRGETNDYIVDYATAEIHFTAKHIIRQDSRIVVEFQYSTNQFTRSLIATETNVEFLSDGGKPARLEVGVSAIRESDGRRLGTEFGFSASDSLLLANAGDNPAFSDGAIRVDYNPEADFVQYVKAQATDSGDSIFVALQSTPAEGQLVYRVRFTRTGEGTGSYRRTGRLINGIVYEYVGHRLGEYDPVRIIARPERKELVVARVVSRPIQGLSVTTEGALSRFDGNLVSSLGASDDAGQAIAVKAILAKTALGTGRFAPVVQLQISQEIESDNFASFDRTRSVEWSRIWNSQIGDAALGGDALGSRQSVHQGDFVADFGEAVTLKTDWGRLVQEGMFSSTRFGSSVESNVANSIGGRYRVDFISSENGDSVGASWFRQIARAEYSPFANTTTFLELETENKESSTSTPDSLDQTSFRFTEIRPGVKLKVNDLELSGTIEFRQDDRPLSSGILNPASRSLTIQSFATYQPNENYNTELSLGIRQLDYDDVYRIDQGASGLSSVVLHWSGFARPAKRALRTSWLYDANTERAPKLQEFYIRTGPELGEYVWVDSNGDGAIQIEEFVLETTPSEGNYIKSFVPSDSLFPVINVQARLRVDTDASKLAIVESSRFNFLRHVQTRSIVRIDEKNRRPDIRQIYLLRLGEFRDPKNTISGRMTLQQDVYLFRRNPKFGLDYLFIYSKALSDLSAGLESRANISNRLLANYRAATWLRLELDGSIGRNRLLSATFGSRTFSISSWSISPRVTYLFNQHAQVSFAPEYSHKDDDVGTRESSIYKIPVELRYLRPRKMQIFGRLEMADVSIQGDASGLAQYQLTDGRGDGRSFLWSLNVQVTLSRLLKATIAYDGRDPSAGRTVHTGRMQLSASF